MTFDGSFGVETYLDNDTINLILGLNKSRRVKRDTKALARKLDISVKECLETYLEDGQLYVPDCDDFTDDESVVSLNEPPSDQPGLFCKWTVDVEDNSIVWDGTQDFENFFEWLNYLIEIVLKPRGYVVNGKVRYVGKRLDDMGLITVKKNDVLLKRFVGY